jgi:hypothetical protein
LSRGTKLFAGLAELVAPPPQHLHLVLYVSRSPYDEVDDEDDDEGHEINAMADDDMDDAVLPELASKYPNMAMVAVVAATQAPVAKFTPQGLTESANGAIYFLVLSPNGTAIPVFTLGLNLTAAIEVRSLARPSSPTARACVCAVACACACAARFFFFF